MGIRQRLISAASTWLLPGERPVVPAALETAALVSLQQTTAEQAQSALDMSSALTAQTTQQRAALEATTDQLKLLSAATRRLQSTCDQVNHQLEQLRIMSLNAGLEGVRRGDDQGQALQLVAEELASRVETSSSALDELTSTANEIGARHDTLKQQLLESRDRAGALGNELLNAQARQSEAVRSLKELGANLMRLTGTDPESAKWIADAAAHAEKLLDALAHINAKGAQSTARGALNPTLKPLSRTLAELQQEADDYR